MYMTVKQAAEKWGLSDRRVRILCAEGKIPGTFQEGRGWKIPADAVKPADGRFRSTESLLDTIDRKKAELDTRRPLTKGEVARLTEEFIVEYTYNSNAIEGNTLTLRETDLVLRGLTIDQKPLKDHMEAVGHKEPSILSGSWCRIKHPCLNGSFSRSTIWCWQIRRMTEGYTAGFLSESWAPSMSRYSLILSSQKWNSSWRRSLKAQSILSPNWLASISNLRASILSLTVMVVLAVCW